MRTIGIYYLIKDSLEFTADITRYTRILEENHHEILARKLLESGLKTNNYLFEAQTAILENDIKNKLAKAKTSAEETLYWYVQCVRSKYFDEDPRLLRIGNNLIKEISTNATN